MGVEVETPYDENTADNLTIGDINYPILSYYY